MELILIIRVLLRRWWIVFIPFAIAAGFAAYEFVSNRAATSGGFAVTLRYTAAHALNTTLPPRDGDYQDIWLASELTVNALTDWVKTSGFAEEVAQLTATEGLEIDLAALAIASDNDRSIGLLTLYWGDEAQLTTIMQAAIEVLQTRSQAYFPQLGDQPASIEIMDVPRIVPVSPALVNRFAPLLRVALGLLAGIALAFLVDYLDPTLRHREELEAMGLTVIASIPRER
jgi:capsular polysaccharide biosynthesis protein